MDFQCVALTAECLVDSIDGLTESGGISKEFVGLILLPIVGNAAGMFILRMFGVALQFDEAPLFQPSSLR